jgi:hypothetical protein
MMNDGPRELGRVRPYGKLCADHGKRGSNKVLSEKLVAVVVCMRCRSVLSSGTRERPLDWLQFFSSAIHSLAWPATVIAIVILLKREIVALLLRLRSLTYKDLRLDFEKTLEKAEAQVPAALAPVSKYSDGQPTLFYLLAEKEEIEPSGTVLGVWLLIEAALKKAASEAGISANERLASRKHLITELENSGRIDHITAKLLDDLRRLRNIAAHPAEKRKVTQAQALRFVRLADFVLENLPRPPKPTDVSP